MTDLLAWLEEARGVDRALSEDMGLQTRVHPSLGEVLAFPYMRDGKPYAAKFRTADKRWSSTQGVTRGLFNEDALRADRGLPIIITEGELDAISVIQAGFKRAVSLPDGWTAQGNKTDALVEAEALLRESPAVIVAGDNDEAGESLPRAVANLLKGHDVRSVQWPEGCKDANDVLVQRGEAAIVEALNAAPRLDPPGGIITGISDIPPLSRRRVLRTGVREIDWRVALELGAISVVTGIPGHGKSTFTTWALYRIAKAENVRIGMMCFETHPHRTRDHLTRLARGKPFDDLSAAAQREVMAELDENFRLVHRTYDSGAHNLGWLEETLHALVVRDGCKVVVVDPWNELEHLPMPGESLTNYINFALQQMRQWAEKLEAHIMLVAHPKKLHVDGKPRAPIGYDVADSAAFANKPSLGLTIHQDKAEDGVPLVRLLNWKVRDTQLYRADKGVTDLHFDSDLMAYEPFEVTA